MKFNINNDVKVKLTDKGRDIYYHQYDEINKLYGEIVIKPSHPNLDKDGFYESQLWCLMKLFGEHMGNGVEVPFETEIEIPEKTAK